MNPINFNSAELQRGAIHLPDPPHSEHLEVAVTMARNLLSRLERAESEVEWLHGELRQQSRIIKEQDDEIERLIAEIDELEGVER